MTHKVSSNQNQCRIPQFQNSQDFTILGQRVCCQMCWVLVGII